MLAGYEYFLNLGGIANISNSRLAFDVCPANRVLNALAEIEGLHFDAAGAIAATGTIDNVLLQQLDALPYYTLPYPKSLANDFGTETVLPLVLQSVSERGLSIPAALCTYTEHIATQIGRALEKLSAAQGAAAREGSASDGSAGVISADEAARPRMLITGGGAHNSFLVQRLQDMLQGAEVVVPDAGLVDYKEALIMALIGVLRWREENNVLASVTGASRDSIGGAVWIGQEA
jgi:anhydro-N-acetylmuramic acid kinase